jgi:DtxR family transcriptional regulator, Mn-dependent transcriptional regulator
VNEEVEISESVEMYLITIAMLGEEAEPVPLSLLAKKLSHSPVSINEMCRKLVDWGWADYQPYHGVKLTEEGWVLANRVLCRRRLWEVFLVEKLGIEPVQAEAFACNLEHATTEDVTSRLAAYLGHPRYSPQNQPIPCQYEMGPAEQFCDLEELTVGRQGRVIRILETEPVKKYLRSHGLVPGSSLEIVAQASDGSKLVKIKDHYLSVTSSVATHVRIVPMGDDIVDETLIPS